MFHASLFLLLLSAQIPGAAPQEAPPQVPAPTYDQGPLRLEVMAMRELRFWASEPEFAERLAAQAQFNIQWRIRGERITQVVRLGNVILTELVDSTGQSLLDPNSIPETERTMTRALSPQQQAGLAKEGLIVQTRAKPSSRAAQKLNVIRGAIRLILADKTEKLTIADPLQFYGRTIEDPRLKELGIEIKILPAEELENPRPANRSLLLQYVSKGDHIQSATFYDGAMKRVPAPDNQALTKSGATCLLFTFDAAPINNEWQLVLEVHPQIDEIQLPVVLENVDLP